MKDARFRFASLVASAFAQGDRKRAIACRIAYPFASRDEAPARWVYRRCHGVEPDLDSPRGLDEKICWLKIHDRRPLLTRMSCKFEAREVVRERGFGRLLKKLYGVWERAGDIDFDNLPERFALKATHGTKMNYFHLGGRTLDREALVEMARGWLDTDIDSRSGQWGYRNIKPRILAEELLPHVASIGLPELRVMCFGGEPQVIRRSHGLNHPTAQQECAQLINLHLDPDWNRMAFRDPRRGWPEMPERPEYLYELVDAARALSRDMPFVRVDFTDCGGRLFFGEFTLYPNSGCNRWEPPETDRMLGDMVDLPDPAGLR